MIIIKKMITTKNNMMKVIEKIHTLIMMSLRITKVIMIKTLKIVKIRISSKTKKVSGLRKISRMLILIKKSMIILINNTNKKIQIETIKNQIILEPKIKNKS